MMVAAPSAPVPCPADAHSPVVLRAATALPALHMVSDSTSDSVESGVRAPVNIELVVNVRTANARAI